MDSWFTIPNRAAPVKWTFSNWLTLRSNLISITLCQVDIMLNVYQMSNYPQNVKLL